MPSQESEGQLQLAFDTEPVDGVVESGLEQEPVDTELVSAAAGRVATDYLERRVSEAAIDQGWGRVPDTVIAARTTSGRRKTANEKRQEAKERALHQQERTQAVLDKLRKDDVAYLKTRSHPKRHARVEDSIAAARKHLERG